MVINNISAIMWTTNFKYEPINLFIISLKKCLEVSYWSYSYVKCLEVSYWSYSYVICQNESCRAGPTPMDCLNLTFLQIDLAFVWKLLMNHILTFFWQNIPLNKEIKVQESCLAIKGRRENERENVRQKGQMSNAAWAPQARRLLFARTSAVDYPL